MMNTSQFIRTTELSWRTRSKTEAAEIFKSGNQEGRKRQATRFGQAETFLVLIGAHRSDLVELGGVCRSLVTQPLGTTVRNEIVRREWIEDDDDDDDEHD